MRGRRREGARHGKMGTSSSFAVPLLSASVPTVAMAEEEELRAEEGEARDEQGVTSWGQAPVMGAQVITGTHGSFMAMDIAVDDYSKGQNVTTWVRIKHSKRELSLVLFNKLSSILSSNCTIICRCDNLS